MIDIAKAKQIALKEMPNHQISKSVRYRDYFVLFMQRGGIDPSSRNAEMDSYVFVNARTGKVEYRQPWEFDDFPDKAVVLPS